MLRRVLIVLLAFAALACGRGEQVTRLRYEQAPVVLISIDTLRADRLPMYGYKGVETPHLDAFRRDAILFANAYSHVPLTLPSHASMLTGKLPFEHKVRNNIGYVLDAAAETLPLTLKERGYATGAAVSAYVLRGSAGLARSFDFYEDGIANRGNVAVGMLSRSGRATTQIASNWIRQHGDRPFFFMLHLFEPHAPYEPEPEFRRFASEYDGEVATVDAIAGSFIDDLKKQGIYDRAIVIVVSDHGEGLNDHGEPEHGIFVYREAVHVPLLVKLPKSERGGETITGPVGLYDIAPTIAALTGARPPAGATGQSLFASGAAREIYSESLYPRIHLGWSELRSITNATHQFIEAPRPELYDVVADPAQRRNILSDERRTYAAMRQSMAKYAAAVEMPGTIDPEEAKKLAALGYLSSSPATTGGPLPDPKDRIGEVSAMVRASNFLRQRRYEEAIAGFREILRANPRLADGWNQLGVALEGAGRFEEAAEVYKNGVEVAPELAGEFALRRGSMLLRLERYEEAAQHARLGERSNPGAMHLLLGRIALAQKKFAESEREVRAAASDPTNRLAADLLLAQIYAQQSRLPEALALVGEITAKVERERLGPVESLEYVRGDVLARMERYDEAEAAFKREIAAFPQYRQTYANLYLVYMVRDRPVDAQRILEAMVVANPTRSTMLFAARTADALGDVAVARQWQQRAQRSPS